MDPQHHEKGKAARRERPEDVGPTGEKSPTKRPKVSLRFKPEDVATALSSTTEGGETQAEALFAQGRDEYACGAFAHAVKLFEAAAYGFRTLGNKRREASAWGNAGQAYKKLEASEKACSSLEMALQAAQDAQDATAEGRTYLLLAGVHENLGHFEEAVSLLEQALGVAQEQGNHPKEQGLLCEVEALGTRLAKRGKEEHAHKRLREALASLRAAEQAFRLFGDRVRQATCLGNMSVVFNDLHEPEKGAACCREQLLLAHAVRDAEGVNRALTNSLICRFNGGLIHKERGELLGAIEAFQDALELVRQLRGPESSPLPLTRKEVQILGLLGTCSLQRREFAGASDHFARALDMAKASGDVEYMCRASTGLANVHEELRKRGHSTWQHVAHLRERALIHHEKFALPRMLSRPREAFLEDEAIHNFMTADTEFRRLFETVVSEFTTQGMYNEARSVCKEAADAALRLDDRALLREALGWEVGVLQACGNEQEALHVRERSLALAREDNSHWEVGLELLKLSAQLLKGGKLQPALACLEEAAALRVESVGLFPLSEPQRLFHGLALWQLGYVLFALCESPERAETTLWTAIESLESGSMEQKKAHAGLCGRGGRGWQNVDGVRGLHPDFHNDIQEVIRERPESSAYRALMMVQVARGNVDGALEVIERVRWHACSGDTTRQAPPRIEWLQRIARDHARTFVVYALAYNPPPQGSGFSQSTSYEESVYIWVIRSSDGVCLFRRRATRTYLDTRSVGEFVAALRCGGLGVQKVGRERSTLDTRRMAPLDLMCDACADAPTDGVPWCEGLRKLHALLIEPILEYLPHEVEDLVTFVPEGPLFLVPFSALCDEHGRFLIERHTITVMPSVCCLDMVHKRRGTRSSAGLVVCNPLPVVGMPSLSGIEEEALRVATHFGDNHRLLLGDELTREGLLTALSDGCCTLHVAAHVRIDECDPPASYIPLGGDTRVSIAELTHHFPSCVEVVLGHCAIGTSILSGRGVEGIARILLCAGARSVLLSLWASDVEVTGRLMGAIYDNQNSAARALSQSIREILHETRLHPQLWSGFVAFGI